MEESGDIDAMAHELRILTLLMSKLWQRDLEKRLGACSTNISGLQYGILRAISHYPHTISELSRMFLLDPSTLVPAVDVLERNGLAARGKDPRDRRRSPLSLTERGATLIASVPMVAEEDAIVVGLAQMGPEQSRELLRLLRGLVEPIAELEATVSELLALMRPRGQEHRAD